MKNSGGKNEKYSKENMKKKAFMGCQSLTEIDMNKEYKYFSTKMKIRAYKKQGKKIYTKWNNYLDARSVYGSNFN